MKKCLFYLIIVVLNFVFISDVFAEEYLIKVKVSVNSSLSLRKSASTSSTILESLKNDTIHTLLSTEAEDGFYKIESSNGITGYVSSDYVLPYIDFTKEVSSSTNACALELKDAGFHDTSYYPYLCFVKINNPKWNFVAVDTNLDWTTAVDKESTCGKSYIATTYSGYIDSSCNNEYTSTWYPASNTAVAYYMDPRNFLAENFLFQFETLIYDDALTKSYPTLVNTTINNAEFNKYHAGIGNDLSALLTSAGEKQNVSPTFMAARILQELGSSTTLYNLYSGVYSGYEDYYNFINWGVTDSCATTSGTTVCGLTSAKSYGWKGVTAALEGAASSIGESYIHKGQYTTYLQKFNVAPTSSSQLYLHQYMTNIVAPSSEGKSMYNTINSNDLLDNAYSFSIPIYNDMDTLIENESSGGSGTTGNDNLSGLSTSTIVTSAGFTTNNEYITGASVGSSSDEFREKLEAVAGKGNVVVKDKDGKEVTDSLIATGFVVTITNAIGSTSFTIVVKGDTSGDGVINALDLLQVQKNILGSYTLEGAFKEAGDTSGDGVVNALDLLQVQKSILGSYEIEQ